MPQPVERDDIDIVVELIGGSSGRLADRSGIVVGRPVISANKALCSRSPVPSSRTSPWPRLDLLYEPPSPGDPCHPAVRQSWPASALLRGDGIVNGTTNFILTPWRRGRRLRGRTRRGPVTRHGRARSTADVEGTMQQPRRRSWALSHSVATWSPPTCPSRASARCVPPTSPFRPAARLRHQAAGRRRAGGGRPRDLGAGVPAMVRNSHPLATVNGSFNAVFIEGEHCGELMLYGAGGRAGHRQRRARRRHRRGAPSPLGFRRPGAVSRSARQVPPTTSCAPPTT